jgi:hypothetical protein
MEKKQGKSRRNGAIVFSVAALSMVTACGPNYSGEGNDFTVDGTVTTAGSRSLTADIYGIKKEEGQAKGWFEDGVSHQIHDNCDCDSDFWTSNIKVGRVLDLQGQEIEPFQVAVGACVEFEGKIRADQEGKYHHDRPVYDVAQEIPCETH